MDRDMQHAMIGLNQFENLCDKSKELIFHYLYKDEFSGRYIQDILSHVALGNYKSPIEEMFAVCLEIKLSEIRDQFFYELFEFTVQEKINVNDKTYYADFYFNSSDKCFVKAEKDIKLIVECDGHEFHEKTKEQVERGNERDLNLRMNGYDIIHFSGSQIYKNPKKCVSDFLKYYVRLMGDISKI